MCSLDSSGAISAASRVHSSGPERSAGTEMHVPTLESSAATSSQTSALRLEMYTLAPASTKPRAIISPIPRLPPVTRAVLPEMSKRLVIGATLSEHTNVIQDEPHGKEPSDTGEEDGNGRGDRVGARDAGPPARS